MNNCENNGEGHAWLGGRNLHTGSEVHEGFHLSARHYYPLDFCPSALRLRSYSWRGCTKLAKNVRKAKHNDESEIYQDTYGPFQNRTWFFTFSYVAPTSTAML